jgi:uncharacterized protein
MLNTRNIILKYYTEDSDLYKILIHHSEQVKNKAIEVARRHPELNIDLQFVEEASMLHDIGIYLCNAPSIRCFGNHQYIEHGYLGANLLRNEGLPQHALVCERHTGVGLSLQLIIEQNLPLPHRDLIPVSQEEQVICYADKFFSKSKLEEQLSVDYILSHLKKHDERYPDIFLQWHEMFG